VSARTGILPAQDATAIVPSLETEESPVDVDSLREVVGWFGRHGFGVVIEQRDGYYRASLTVKEGSAMFAPDSLGS